MKSIVTLIIMILACSYISIAQTTFFDDFESYTSGDKLAASSSVWKTWTQPYSATEDVTVVSTNAHSGSNSIYFKSTSGGPTDIILPFGNAYNTGVFELGMQVFVTSGKEAYFNLQKTTTPGQIWAIDVYFKSNGIIEFSNGGTLLYSTPYTQNTWVDFKLSINLNNSTWDVLLNGTSVGTFQNSIYQIGCMDIYAIQNSDFYIDDVSTTYSPYTMPQINASLAVLSVPNGLAGQSIKPTLTVRNLGQQTITSYSVKVTYNGNVYPQTVTGLNLASGVETQLTLDQAIILVGGNNPITAEITTVNGAADDDLSDNVKSISIAPLVPAPGKIVVAEEGTGTWCGWCPRGTVFMDNMTHNFTEYFAPIAVHNGDPMKVTDYDTPLSAFFSGYPSVLVDRGSPIDPSAIENDFVTRIQIAPKAILINGATYDAVTGTLKVSIKTTAQGPFSGNYKIACVLTEDGVKGTGSGWAQSNYYSGGGSGVMGGFELLANPVPATQMIYNHVARIISPTFNGLANAFGSATTGDSFIHNFTFTIPAEWKVDSLHIIGLFINPSGKIDNASNTTVQKAISNGYIEGTDVTGVTALSPNNNAVVQIYPNPTTDLAMLELHLTKVEDVTVTVVRMDGVQVSERIYSALSGVQQIPMSLSGLDSGCYFVKVRSGQIQKQLMLIKQ